MMHEECKWCEHPKYRHLYPDGKRTGPCHAQNMAADGRCDCRRYECGCALCELGAPEADWANVPYEPTTWTPPAKEEVVAEDVAEEATTEDEPKELERPEDVPF